MRVSILVPCRGHAEFVRACLGSLLGSDPGGHELEWLLADDGSPDATAEALEAFAAAARGKGTRAKVLRVSPSVGAVEARNRLMREATGERIAFLDSDVLLRTRAWLPRLAARLEESPRRGIVSPKLVYPRAPFRIQCAGCDLTAGGRVYFRGRTEPREAPAWNAPASLPAVTSACWLMPRALWDELGELDEQFGPLQYEDVDYCFRAREAGREVFYAPEVEMYHCENVTSDRTAALNYRYLTVRNLARFQAKWRAKIEAEAEGRLPDESFAWPRVEPVRLAELDGLPTLP